MRWSTKPKVVSLKSNIIELCHKWWRIEFNVLNETVATTKDTAEIKDKNTVINCKN
jgi:hypothetical protein